MVAPLYYEDFAVGQQFRSAREYVMEKDAAITFAQEFDPQAQHVDDAAAKESLFGQLVVSGWHTAAATMRLKTETDLFRVAEGVVGMGLETVRWPVPTLPGDRLRIVITILAMRISVSRPTKGIIRYQVETFNQRDERAMEMVTSVMVPRRTGI
jgi:acyl dehydratase